MSINAYAYLRVSSAKQILGHGFTRQQETIDWTASRLGLNIVSAFRDEAISGTVQWRDRPAFASMIERVMDDPSVTTIIVENLTRLAREYTVQDAILLFLASKGIDLISADTGENITEAVRSDPMKKALIQMQAVFSELEKNSLIRKLKAARVRKKELTGRCEGESREEFEASLEKFEGRFFLNAHIRNDGKEMNIWSPYYTREEGSAEAFRILMQAISDTIAVREKMKKEEAAAQSK